MGALLNELVDNIYHKSLFWDFPWRFNMRASIMQNGLSPFLFFLQFE